MSIATCHQLYSLIPGLFTSLVLACLLQRGEVLLKTENVENLRHARLRALTSCTLWLQLLISFTQKVAVVAKMKATASF